MRLKGKFSLHASRRLGPLALGAVALATVGLTLIGTASVAGASGIPTGGTKEGGGTVRWAEPPQATPTYIFPFIRPRTNPSTTSPSSST